MHKNIYEFILVTRMEYFSLPNCLIKQQLMCTVYSVQASVSLSNLYLKSIYKYSI